MYPIAFHIGRLTIRMYGVMAALGFLSGCFLVTKLRKYAKMSADQASVSLFVAMAAGITASPAIRATAVSAATTTRAFRTRFSFLSR